MTRRKGWAPLAVCLVALALVCGGLSIAPSVDAAELVTDGGFELGPDSGAWIEASTEFGTPICDVSCGPPSDVGARAGNFWAWFGGTTAEETASVRQTVVIPTGASELTFWLAIPECTSGATDTFAVKIGTQTVFSMTNATADPACGTTVNPYEQKTVPVTGNGTAQTLSFEGTFTAGGTGTTSFMVDDISLVSTNNAPVLAPIGPKSVNEAQSLSFPISATDADGDALTYSATAPLPSGAAFNAGTQTFSWTPGFTQAGTYSVQFRVSDGTAEDTETVTITVNNVNRPPVLTSPGNKAVAEGQTLAFQLSASDPDGEPLTFSGSNLPAGASVSSAGQFSWTPTFEQEGTHTNVGLVVSDGAATDSETITITVSHANAPPVLGTIGDKSVDENELLSFTVSATDVDGDPLTYAATPPLPSGASFNAGTRTFSWTPSFAQAGNHNVQFTVTDGTVQDSETITISVGNVNRPPVLTSPGNQTVDEGQLLSFQLSATDPDGQTLTYSGANLPSGAAVSSSGQFSWTPSFTQAGTHPNVELIANDGAATDSEFITITVNNVNGPPSLASIGNKTATEGQLLSFTVSATDPDGDALTYSATGLPSGATFNPATRQFSWTPGATDVGGHPVHFEVSDAIATDSEDITVTVKGLTSTTLTVRKTEAKIKAKGTVAPAHPGATVTVELFRKRGATFRKLKTLNVTLSSSSSFAGAFKRPAAGKCKILATFPGDADHAPSTATKGFSC